jgi:hypothetical protein
MVCCRATGCRISLGVELDAATFDKIPDFVATSYCGSCAATIRGRKTDAWIEAAEFEQARSPTAWRKPATGSPPSRACRQSSPADNEAAN